MTLDDLISQVDALIKATPDAKMLTLSVPLEDYWTIVFPDEEHKHIGVSVSKELNQRFPAWDFWTTGAKVAPVINIKRKHWIKNPLEGCDGTNQIPD